MPQLPTQLREMWQSEYGLTSYDAQILTQEKATAEYFQKLVNLMGSDLAKQSANWIAGDFASAVNRDGIDASSAPIKPEHLAELIKRVVDGTISNKIAKEIFTTLWDRAKEKDLPLIGAVDALIDEKGLRQISDTGAIEKIIDEVLLANPKSVEEYRSGKEKAFNALVGQIMKASKGKANPGQVNTLLKQKLG
jgi:aspartyl-tRNA(Asn)/glutamyl-tRNA(Gln) amidotransferase subunit B